MSRLDCVKHIGLVVTLVLALGSAGCNWETDELPATDELTATELAQLQGLQVWKLRLFVPPHKDYLNFGMFTEEEILEHIRLGFSNEADTVKVSLSFKVSLKGDTAEVGTLFDNGTSMRARMELPPWSTGMPSTYEPKLLGDRYHVLSMKKDGEDTVYYGFWFN